MKYVVGDYYKRCDDDSRIDLIKVLDVSSSLVFEIITVKEPNFDVWRVPRSIGDIAVFNLIGDYFKKVCILELRKVLNEKKDK